MSDKLFGSNKNPDSSSWKKVRDEKKVFESFCHSGESRIGVQDRRPNPDLLAATMFSA